jgi:hypothetical protein
MESERNVNVYIHKRKSDGSVFYVGQGKNNRFKSKKGRSEIWKQIVFECGFDYEILNHNVTRLEAFELEKKHISFYGIENLCNMTIGGLGGDVVSYNINRDEIRLKQKQNTPKGILNPNFGGKFHSEEYFKKQSESNSKVHLRLLNTITNEELHFSNSKEVAKFLGCSDGFVRVAKNKGYKLAKIYLVFNN